VAACVLLLTAGGAYSQTKDDAPPVPLSPDLDAQRNASLGRRMTEIIDLFNGNMSGFRESMFSPGLLEIMSLDDLRVKLDNIYKKTGGFILLGTRPVDEYTMVAWVRPAGGEASNQNFDLTVTIEKTLPYAIDDLAFELSQRPDLSRYTSWDVVDAELEKYPASASLGAWEVLPGGRLKVVHRYRADERRSVATASSLWIVAEIVDLIRKGDLSWDGTLRIRSDLKSLPTSTNLYDLPSGYELPLVDAVRAMNREVDSTAFDHLVNLLGRNALTHKMAAAFGGDQDDLDQLDPFLTTKELFRLKCGMTSDPADYYAKLSPAERRKALRDVVPEHRVFSEFFHSWSHPIHMEEIGWFGNADGLGASMAELWNVRTDPGMEPLDDVMQIADRFPVDRQAWQRAWFTVGAEPGAIAGVWALQRSDGRVFILSVIFNNPKKDIHEALGTETVFAARDLLKKLK